MLKGVLCKAREHVLPRALALDEVGGVRLVYMQQAKEGILEHQERDEHGITIARERSDDEPCEGVEQVVVRGRDDGEEDEGWVEEEERACIRGLCAAGGVGAKGDADDERVAEVEGGHRRERVAEFVRGPDGAGAVLVDRVDEAVCGGEEARGHAGPEREDDKGEQVGERHGAAHGRVNAERLCVVEVGEKGDRRWYVNERVYPVRARALVHLYFLISEWKPTHRFRAEIAHACCIMVS